MTEQELVSIITEAFPVTPVPPADGLIEHYMGEEAARFLGGRQWCDVIEDLWTVNRDGETLISLSPTAFSYYLPAYLLATLEHQGSEWFVGFLLSALYPPEWMGPAALEKWQRRMNMLNPLQRNAVRQVLEYLVDNPSVDGASEVQDVSQLRMALANYWGFQGSDVNSTEGG